MKAIMVIGFFLIMGYSFASTKMDILNCYVQQPEVDYPNVAIMYNSESSEELLNDTTYGASLKSMGYNTALYAFHFTSPEGVEVSELEYDAYYGLTSASYNEGTHLINSNNQYLFPVDANTSYDLLFVPQNPVDGVDFVAAYVFNSADPADAAPIAIMTCVQDTLEIE